MLYQYSTQAVILKHGKKGLGKCLRLIVRKSMAQPVWYSRRSPNKPIVSMNLAYRNACDLDYKFISKVSTESTKNLIKSCRVVNGKCCYESFS